MAEPKIKPVKRVAGASKFRLPERAPRVADINPLRELLQEAKAQEEAAVEATQVRGHSPAKTSAKISQFPAPAPQQENTPAKQIAGVFRSSEAKATAGGTNTFGDFAKRWSPILRSGQMSVCRALFEMTHALGQDECFTSMPKLADAAGLKERQCYNVVAQLELLGFIERPDIYNTPTRKGTVFRLYLAPQSSSSSRRRYHIGGEHNQS